MPKAKMRHVCPKCGTFKNSEKMSCCAFDGAWYKKCGNANDPDFDHTWYEGIQACKEAQAQAMSRPKTNDTLQSHAAQEKINDPTVVSASVVKTNDCEACDRKISLIIIFSYNFLQVSIHI